MAVLSKEDLLNSIKDRIGENTDDDTISFLENVSDTITDYEAKANGDGEDWKSKYEENDKEWRRKYTDRFFNTNDKPEDERKEDETEEPESPKTFEDLFKVKEN